MDKTELEHYFQNSTVIQDPQEAPEELVNLAGYQVTKAELFAHSREPVYVKIDFACGIESET